MKVMIVVTHLLGSGHLARALTLGRAMQKAGQKMHIVSGGLPAPLLDRGEITLTQLPPVRSDGTDFARLLDAEGNPVSADYMASRADMLVDQLRQEEPDVLLTELFPFGRRVLRVEFTQLLEAAADLPRRPFVAVSLRDILAPPSKEAKARFASGMVAAHYDAVLVHADPDVVKLEQSWPVTKAIRDRLHYTGFVAPAPPTTPDTTRGRGEVIVSAGGAVGVGGPLFAAALTAARQNPERRWRILIGGAQAAETIAKLKDLPDNALVEPARPDFRNLLCLAEASISLCGYNTALDILQTGCPAVFVPFDEGGEVEQTLRADALSRLPGIVTCRSAELSAASLLNRLDELQKAPRRPPSRTGMNGASETARLLARLAEGQR